MTYILACLQQKMYTNKKTYKYIPQYDLIGMLYTEVQAYALHKFQQNFKLFDSQS